MTNELAILSAETPQPASWRLPPVPWRDPHTVSPVLLGEYIQALEMACTQKPKSADLRTCLGMAYAMKLDIYKSMDALELAVKCEPEHFWAQMKYAELNYRLRALHKAEAEMVRALELATNRYEMAVARKMLQEIRTLHRSGTQKPEWTKPLTTPALCLVAMMLVLSLAVYWK